MERKLDVLSAIARGKSKQEIADAFLPQPSDYNRALMESRIRTSIPVERINFTYKTAYFCDDSAYAFMDRYIVPLSVKSLRIENDCLAAVEDLVSLFSMELISYCDSGAVIVYQGQKVCVLAESSSGSDIPEVGESTILRGKVINGWLYVGVYELMCVTFNMKCIQKSGYLAIGQELSDFTMMDVKFLNARLRGKTEGDLYLTYWNPDIARWVPVRVYLPTTYNPLQPSKLIISLHGGMGGPDSNFVRSENNLQYHAEKHNTIIAGLDCAIKNGAYGNCFPVTGAHPEEKIDLNSPENPLNYSDEELSLRVMAEKNAILAMEVIQTIFSIDPQCVFLFGNSMGGEGTLSLAASHPDRFRAICPCGASIDTRFFDAQQLKQIPVLVIAGTEDMHGYDFIRDSCKTMILQGAQLTLLPVGGGEHANAWVKSIPEIFSFFENHSM